MKPNSPVSKIIAAFDKREIEIEETKEKKNAVKTAEAEIRWERHIKSQNFTMPEHKEKEQRERMIKEFMEKNK